MEEEKPALVIDIGSYSCRLGLAGSDAPESMRRLPVATDADSPSFAQVTPHEKSQGDSAVWSNHEDALKHLEAAFNELKEKKPDAIATKSWSEFNLLFLIDPFTPTSQLERLCGTLFEDNNVVGLYFTKAPLAALYSFGRTTGQVIHIGESATSLLTVMEGNSSSSGYRRGALSGRHVTAYLKTLLVHDEQRVSYEEASKLKEDHCYSAANFEAESQRSDSQSDLERLAVLPSGATIRLRDERFRAPEVLFKPSLGGYETDGLGWLVHDALIEAPIDFRRDLHQNIVLSGGVSSLAGLGQRLENELRFIDPIMSTQARTVSLNDSLPSLCPWTGGSIIASLSTFQQFWVTREEFAEAGPRPMVKRMGF